MAVTMALIILAVSPSFSIEDSNGTCDLTDGIKKAKILISLNNSSPLFNYLYKK